MRICIIGAGAIGSTFAFQLARAGHEVTVVARGARLAEVERDGIVTTRGATASVRAVGALPEQDPFDLVLVTVLPWQIDPLLPALRASAASVVMFMFNTFGGLDRLRETVGDSRFALGFPAMLSTLENGKLDAFVVPRILGAFQITTVGGVNAAIFRDVFSRAGIATVMNTDMDSWLRTHAALMAPIMAGGAAASARGAGVRWAEARDFARGIGAGFDIVRRGGHALTPWNIALVNYLPTFVLTFALWLASRMPSARTMGARGPAEPRFLIDAMCAEAGDASADAKAALQKIRPS